MNQPITKSSLSQAQARFVELLQNLNFGRIEGLHVRDGQPVFEPAPRVVQKLKMCGDNAPRREADLPNFYLKQQTVEMLQTLAEIGDGQVLSIEVKNGLPFAVEVERRQAADGGDRG